MRPYVEPVCMSGLHNSEYGPFLGLSGMKEDVANYKLAERRGSRQHGHGVFTYSAAARTRGTRS